MAKKKRKSVKKTGRLVKRNSKPVAILSLILNILLPFGLGSLVGGKIKEGVSQASLTVIGLILFSFKLIAFPILAISWIWGILTGVRLLRESK